MLPVGKVQARVTVGGNILKSIWKFKKKRHANIDKKTTGLACKKANWPRLASYSDGGKLPFRKQKNKKIIIIKSKAAQGNHHSRKCQQRPQQRWRSNYDP